MLKRKNEQGYSLIEITLYVALLGIFLTTITSLFISSVDLRFETESTSSIQQDGRYLLSRFRYDVINASSIVSPASLGGSSNSLQIVRNGTTYTYSLDNGNLLVSDGVSSDQLNSSQVHVNSISFTRLGNPGGKNTLTIDYVLESVVERADGPETKDYTVTYGIR